MNKFTIVTIILAVSVITVTVDLAVRDFVDANGQASVLTEIAADPIDEKPAEETVPVAPAGPTNPDAPVTPIQPPILDTPTSAVPKLTQAVLSQAGFPGNPSQTLFKGKVFELLDITQIAVDGIEYYQIIPEGSSAPVVSVTEIMLRDEIRALQLYILLQNKTKPYIDLKLNETNTYGDRSFYINHSKKDQEAFLTVKIGSRILCVAYAKPYHDQVKQLVELLSK